MLRGRRLRAGHRRRGRRARVPRRREDGDRGEARPAGRLLGHELRRLVRRDRAGLATRGSSSSCRVDEPQGQIFGGVVAAPAFRDIARFALQYLDVPPDDCRCADGCSTACGRPRSPPPPHGDHSEVRWSPVCGKVPHLSHFGDDSGARVAAEPAVRLARRGPGAADRRARAGWTSSGRRRPRFATSPTTRAPSTPGRCSSACPGERADGHDFAPEAVANGRRRARRRAAARPCRCRSSSSPTRARRWPSRRTSSSAADRGADRRGRHRHEPGRRRRRFSSTRCSPRPGAGPACSARSRPASTASAVRRPGRPPRRSTSSACSARCSTPATAAARWRRPRTARRSSGSTASASPPSSSPTSTRITSTSTRTWRTTSTRSARLFVATLRRPPPSTSAIHAAAGSPTSSADGGRRSSPTASTRRRRGPVPTTVDGRTPKLVGRFNLENVLGAVAAARLLGLPEDAVATRDRLGHRRPRAVRVGGRGTGLRGDRRLRPQAGRARERAPHRARAGRRPR